MVPEEIIGADTSVQPFLSEGKPEGYMNIRNSFDIEREALLLQPVAGWSMADMPEPAEWLISGCFNAEGELREPLEQGWEEFPLPSLAFGDEDEDDDIEDDEDNFDDMEDDFEDDFEDEDDDFEDEDDDFEDEDEDDDYDYDEDGDFDDDFEE